MLAWTLTDGSAEDEIRCLGVAEAIADRIERRRIAPRGRYGWLAPFGPIDPRDAPGAAGGPITPLRGWPELVVGAGRKAVPYLASVKRASGGRTITAFMGATLAGRAVADIVAVDQGERLRGPNVVATPTRPHRMSAARLIAARGAPALFPTDARGRRVGVLLGARRTRWCAEDVSRLAAGLGRLRDDGAIIAVVPSRDADERLDMAVRTSAHYLWDRQGQDPTARLLAQSDALVASADNLLVLDEAVATGLPVMAFRPQGLDRREAAALDRLVSLGAARIFSGRLEDFAYTPIDSTAEIARAISAVIATRAALRPRPERRAPARSRETNGPNFR
ncbi:mitochondrial fission ELM1 family protein [Chelatococcus sambhunathii]|uniref:Mitochondrial fission ELM1 family protein n=1 Tax=Chelatococcus sambhunathii TaxID=363953 RepID=A0ABU1DJ41_9HYPH|nr:ELM1/GtrOC1 family putative glycosyltransferase [Chelatococcus sambhunathii]MDR4308109.1 mitochondrial fission ELM1 family protein [Chelatococcus sambhunathii]